MSTNLQIIANELEINDPKEAPVPNKIGGNLELRAKVLELAENDIEFQGRIRAIAYSDFSFMCNLFYWTHDPRQGHEPHEKPFVLYNFQEEDVITLQGWLDRGEDGHWDKSRDMGATWLIMCLFLWYWGKDEVGNDFRVGSRKMDYVDKKGDPDTLFYKLKYNIERLPYWLLPPGFDIEKHLNSANLINPSNNNNIVGEANNENFGTGGRRKAILFDEFSKWKDTDHDAWTSAFMATYCRIALSTPWHTALRKFHMLHKDAMAGKINHLRQLWNKHPRKDKAWRAREAARCTPLEMAQEVDISYEGAAGDVYYGTYNPDIHQKNLESIYGSTLIRGWDFGYRHPLCFFSQINHQLDQWLWLKVILGQNVIAPEFAKYVLRMTEEWFPDVDDFLDIGDPAGDYSSDKSYDSSIKLIQNEFKKSNVNIKIQTRRKGRKGEPLNIDRVNSAKGLRNMFSEMTAGHPRILINDEDPDDTKDRPLIIATQSMHYVHIGLTGGCHYEDKPSGKDIYEKDGYYDHFFDVARYVWKFFFEVPSQSKDDEKKMRAIVEERNAKTTEERANVSYIGSRSRQTRSFSPRIEKSRRLH